MKFSPLKLKDKFSKSRFSLGLDIGNSTVKFVKLKFLKDSLELCDMSIQPVGLDLAPILKHIAESQDTKRINLSASGPSTITRYVNFPKMGYDELKNALKFEAQKYIPFSLAEVNLDGYILNPDLPDNKMLVLLAAAKKDFISQRLKSAQDAGLKVNIIDIDSLALVNAFNYNYPVSDNNAKHSAVALLNIGALISNLDILEGDLPRLSRDIHVAGNNFTQKLVDDLGLGFKAAEELKLNPDKERLKDITDAIEPVIANLVSEIRTSFDYFESQSSFSVAKIYLSGAGSLLAGLKVMLADLLGIEVEYWDPLRKLEISDGIDSAKVKASSSALAVAIGLALRSS